MHRFLLSCALFCLSIFSIFAQTEAYRQYIETYKSMAIDQMLRYRIPASITLAQGLLESSAGSSLLATTANNHFGIKTGGSWTGPFVLRTDDAPNEQFRKYNSAAESFEDHSLFLTGRKRYSSLFALAPNDYKGWAYGLKNCGYATNPKYAELLIGVIERYDLAQYDRYEHVAENVFQRVVERKAESVARRLYICNDLVYVIVGAGDSFESIARDMGISERKLRKYNEVDKYYELSRGEVVFLTKKKSRVAKSIRETYHIVAAGESMYSIAQRYGIKMTKLYKWNNLPPTYVPEVGASLLLL